MRTTGALASGGGHFAGGYVAYFAAQRQCSSVSGKQYQPNMDYEFTNGLIGIGVYAAYAIWTILVILLLTALIKRRWNSFKRILKYTLNSTVFIIAFAFILDLALIVRPPVYEETQEKTSVALKAWIKEHQLNDIYVASTAILVLLAINLLFYFKVEHKQNKQDLLILTMFDALILFTSIWLTGENAYFGLMQEVYLHFG